MNDRETLEHLHALIDGELSPETEAAIRARIESCPRTRQAYDDLRAVKEVHSSKLFTPELKSETREFILANLEAPAAPAASEAAPKSSWNLFASRRWLATAAALALISAVALFVAFTPDEPALAHAAVVSHVAHSFSITDTVPPEIPEELERTTLARILYESGIKLEKLPRIAEARFLRFSPTRINTRPEGGEVRGVRLDYQDETRSNQSCPRSVVSIFVFPAHQVLPPDSKTPIPRISSFEVDRSNVKIDCFQCPKARGVNVFCFRDESRVYNFATVSQPREFEPRIVTNFTP